MLLNLNGLTKKQCILCVVGVLCIVVCGLCQKAIAGSKGKSKKSQPPVATVPPLKQSFVIREGRKSIFTCMVVSPKGDVYAAGMANDDCVILKLDSKLKKIKGRVTFGSAHSKRDKIKDMAIDSKGNIFVTGCTDAKDFPVTPGCHNNTTPGILNEQAFLVKFSPKLKLLASTFVGGKLDDVPQAIAIDRDDNVYVAGYTAGYDTSSRRADMSIPFVPPTGAYDRNPAPKRQTKAFVAKLSNDLTTLKAATLLGGNEQKVDSDDEAYDLAIDRDGNVWVTGQTNSEDFPVTRGCLEAFYAGRGDVFVSKLDANLSRLLASTYLGGKNQELATALVVDKKGNVFVGGWTESPDLPMVPGCYDTKYSHEEEDAFIVKLSGDLQQLKAATYLGGDYDASGYGDDLLSAMALSPNGKLLCVTGRSESENFPVTPKCYKKQTMDNDTPVKGHRNRKKPRESSTRDSDYGDGFVTLFNADLTKCPYSTLMGGDDLEYVDDILFDGDDLLVAGISYSDDFPRIIDNKRETGSRGFAIRFNWKKSR